MADVRCWTDPTFTEALSSVRMCTSARSRDCPRRKRVSAADRNSEHETCKIQYMSTYKHCLIMYRYRTTVAHVHVHSLNRVRHPKNISRSSDLFKAGAFRDKNLGEGRRQKYYFMVGCKMQSSTRCIYKGSSCVIYELKLNVFVN